MKAVSPKGELVPLSMRQQAFANEYLIDFNATRAAIRAGYAESSAKMQGARLLGYEKVQKEIIKGNQKRIESTGIDQEYVLTRLRSIVERCMQSEQVKDGNGSTIGEYKFNASAAIKALELLGKHLMMFSDRIDLKVITHEDALRMLE